MIAKTFAYPRDARDPSKGRRLIETRILKREPDGWVGLPYVWNEAQTEATLDVAGDTVDVSWIHTDGQRRTNNYIIPNVQPVQGLPQGRRDDHADRPEGAAPEPRLRLSRRDGEPARPLEPLGALAGAPRPSRPRGWRSGTTRRAARSTPAPAPGWRSTAPTATIPKGPARNSGLDLLASQQNPTSFGIMKPPVAAGIGSGGLPYDIVPGQPDQSILAYRIASTHPGRHDARAGQATGARRGCGSRARVDRQYGRHRAEGIPLTHRLAGSRLKDADRPYRAESSSQKPRHTMNSPE